MSLLDTIVPTSTLRVMDLVREAGIDVSDWANYAKGPSAAAANPKYCYEWAYAGSEVVVLNLWLGNMREEQGRIVHTANYRADAEEHQAAGAKSNWHQRGFALDRALQKALRDNLPIRVIVNVGERRPRNGAEETASSVKKRRLDKEAWTIARYEWATGACDLVRGWHAAPAEAEA